MLTCSYNHKIYSKIIPTYNNCICYENKIECICDPIYKTINYCMCNELFCNDFDCCYYNDLHYTKKCKNNIHFLHIKEYKYCIPCNCPVEIRSCCCDSILEYETIEWCDCEDKNELIEKYPKLFCYECSLK
jgi:hypothetical protein